MINALVLTHKGLEEASANEVQKLVKATNVISAPGKVTFNCKEHQELVDLCYHGRTFTKVVLLLSEFTFEGMPQPRIDNLLFLGKKIIVQCQRTGEHAFTSADVEKEWSQAIAQKHSVEMDYKKPETTYFLLIEDNRAWFGVDFSGIDLGRRDYRIFLGADALKGNIAATLLLIVEYEPKHALLDPFCRQGIIPIEAALYSTNTSPHKYGKEKFAFTKLSGLKYELKDKEKDFKGTIIAMDDNFKNVSNAQKNAKIAGVVKSLDFSRTDLQWLDSKFGKNFLDRIVTYPPQASRILDEKKAEKIYHQLFYHAEFILKKTGKICVVMRRGVEMIKQKAQEFKFVVEKELKVKQGEEELTILVFGR